jgi:arylformamidase
MLRRTERIHSLSRRTFMTGTAAGLVAASQVPTEQAQAQTASPPAAAPKGPPVWLDLDQKALDDAYDQAKYAPNRLQVVGRYRSNSDLTRAHLGAPKRLSYGATPIEGFDLFPTKAPNAPINVFLHGGAWRAELAQYYAFPAEMFVKAGAHYISVDFNNVTETNGDVMPLAEQCRRAVAWIYKNAESFGGDPNRIFISGHSSGGHLGGVVMVTDWEKDFGLPKDVIKGGVLVSGMYDLKPVRLSARSSYVKFTDASEHALSAQRHLDKLNAPVVVAYGALETPEFQRQSRDFADAAKKAGKNAELIKGEGYNHFEFIETLANPHAQLGRAALQQMKLAPA